jgi:hypothetical protein
MILERHIIEMLNQVRYSPIKQQTTPEPKYNKRFSHYLMLVFSFAIGRRLASISESPAT